MVGRVRTQVWQQAAGDAGAIGVLQGAAALHGLHDAAPDDNVGGGNAFGVHEYHCQVGPGCARHARDVTRLQLAVRAGLHTVALATV